MMLLLIAACIAVAFAAPQTRNLMHFGICVEMCNRADPLSCPAGMTCQSNGCGHTCQLAPQKKRPLSFGICAEMCTKGSCPAGMSCRSNGCGHTCQRDVISAINHLANCEPVLCDRYCKYGFAAGKDGCPVCSCRSSPDFHILPIF